MFYNFLRILTKKKKKINLLGASPTGIFQIRNTWKFIIPLSFIELLTNTIGKDWYFVSSFPVLGRYFLHESLFQLVILPFWGKQEQLLPRTCPSSWKARRDIHSRDYLGGTQGGKSLGKWYCELNKSCEKMRKFATRANFKRKKKKEGASPVFHVPGQFNLSPITPAITMVPAPCRGTSRLIIQQDKNIHPKRAAASHLRK